MSEYYRSGLFVGVPEVRVAYGDILTINLLAEILGRNLLVCSKYKDDGQTEIDSCEPTVQFAQVV